MSGYVRQIQTTLKKAGYYKGAIDGIAGKMTVEAVNQAALLSLKGKSLSEVIAEVKETFKSIFK